MRSQYPLAFWAASLKRPDIAYGAKTFIAGQRHPAFSGDTSGQNGLREAR
jgi:hypothetical protein